MAVVVASKLKPKNLPWGSKNQTCETGIRPSQLRRVDKPTHSILSETIKLPQANGFSTVLSSPPVVMRITIRNVSNSPTNLLQIRVTIQDRADAHLPVVGEFVATQTTKMDECFLVYANSMVEILVLPESKLALTCAIASIDVLSAKTWVLMPEQARVREYFTIKQRWKKEQPLTRFEVSDEIPKGVVSKAVASRWEDSKNGVINLSAIPHNFQYTDIIPPIKEKRIKADDAFGFLFRCKPGTYWIKVSNERNILANWVWVKLAVVPVLRSSKHHGVVGDWALGCQVDSTMEQQFCLMEEATIEAIIMHNGYLHPLFRESEFSLSFLRGYDPDEPDAAQSNWGKILEMPDCMSAKAADKRWKEVDQMPVTQTEQATMDNDKVYQLLGGVEEETYENNRKYPIKGWSSRLLPTDRYQWSDVTGKQERKADNIGLPDSSWIWITEWAVRPFVAEDGTTHEWEHAVDFPATYHVKDRALDCVRRRKWHRWRIPNGFQTIADIMSLLSSMTTDKPHEYVRSVEEVHTKTFDFMGYLVAIANCEPKPEFAVKMIRAFVSSISTLSDKIEAGLMEFRDVFSNNLPNGGVAKLVRLLLLSIQFNQFVTVQETDMKEHTPKKRLEEIRQSITNISSFNLASCVTANTPVSICNNDTLMERLELVIQKAAKRTYERIERSFHPSQKTTLISMGEKNLYIISQLLLDFDNIECFASDEGDARIETGIVLLNADDPTGTEAEDDRAQAMTSQALRGGMFTSARRKARQRTVAQAIGTAFTPWNWNWAGKASQMTPPDSPTRKSSKSDICITPLSPNDSQWGWVPHGVETSSQDDQASVITTGVISVDDDANDDNPFTEPAFPSELDIMSHTANEWVKLLLKDVNKYFDRLEEAWTESLFNNKTASSLGESVSNELLEATKSSITDSFQSDSTMPPSDKENISQLNISNSIWTVYNALKKFNTECCEYAEGFNAMYLPDFFQARVLKYLEYSAMTINHAIHKAFQLDSLEAVSPSALYSSAALDVIFCVKQHVSWILDLLAEWGNDAPPMYYPKKDDPHYYENTTHKSKQAIMLLFMRIISNSLSQYSAACSSQFLEVQQTQLVPAEQDPSEFKIPVKMCTCIHNLEFALDQWMNIQEKVTEAFEDASDEFHAEHDKFNEQGIYVLQRAKTKMFQSMMELLTPVVKKVMTAILGHTYDPAKQLVVKEKPTDSFIGSLKKELGVGETPFLLTIIDDEPAVGLEPLFSVFDNNIQQLQEHCGSIFSHKKILTTVYTVTLQAILTLVLPDYELSSSLLLSAGDIEKLTSCVDEIQAYFATDERIKHNVDELTQDLMKFFQIYTDDDNALIFQWVDVALKQEESIANGTETVTDKARLSRKPFHNTHNLLQLLKRRAFVQRQEQARFFLELVAKETTRPEAEEIKAFIASQTKFEAKRDSAAKRDTKVLRSGSPSVSPVCNLRSSGSSQALKPPAAVAAVTTTAAPAPPTEKDPKVRQRASSSTQVVVTDATGKQRAMVQEEVYENQRKYPLIGWSAQLLPTERETFTDERGKWKLRTDRLVPQGWHWVGDWTVSLENTPGAGGWMYADDWQQPWIPDFSAKAGHNVRRRLWIRMREPDEMQT